MGITVEHVEMMITIVSLTLTFTNSNYSNCNHENFLHVKRH